MINFKEIVLVLLSFYTALTFSAETTDTFVVKTSRDIRELENGLLVFNFKYKSKITPGIYSFKYEGSSKDSKIEHVISEVIRIYGDKVEEIERTKEYVTWIPADRLYVTSVGGSDFERPNSHSEEYFGMHVEGAWSSGHSGNGINVAVPDVGINNDILDLKSNLNLALAFNFIKNTSDTTPEFFEHYRADVMPLVDHGNRCGSVIAAEKGNKLCSAGIAYKAKIVPLKIFSVLHDYHVFKLNTSTDIIAAALAYSLQQIHIFSNSWGPTSTFEPLDMPTREAVQFGATIGRNKLGIIYVVPDGSDGVSGSGLANSIYTIAVNSVGLNGTLPVHPQVSACVLTSGLGEGSTLQTNKMYTSSYNNTCISSFRGVSAAVAQVSAIIALVLESRPDLTVRDIQHLLVHSSGRENLEEFNKFQRNGAGRYYHPFFGFGLLNAEEIVRRSETWQRIGKVYRKSMRLPTIKIIPEQRRYVHSFPHISKRMTILKFHFKEECEPPLNAIEHVVLQLSYDIIKKKHVRMEIVSPSHTASLLVDTDQVTDFSHDKKTRRNLTSVHFWDETPFGHWKVKIQHKHDIDTEYLEATTLTVYGTFNVTKAKVLDLPWSCVAVNQTNITQQPKYDVLQTTKSSGKMADKGKVHNAVARISPLFYSLILVLGRNILF